MFAAKKIPGVALVLLLSIGAVCAQICDVGCVAQSEQSGQSGQKGAATSVAEHQTGAPGHCHQQAPQQSKQKHSEPRKDHSSDCQSHGHPAALIKSGQSAVADVLSDIPAPVAGLFYLFDASLDRIVDGRVHAGPHPSPPPAALHSILRI